MKTVISARVYNGENPIIMLLLPKTFLCNKTTDVLDVLDCLGKI